MSGNLGPGLDYMINSYKTKLVTFLCQEHFLAKINEKIAMPLITYLYVINKKISMKIPGV